MALLVVALSVWPPSSAPAQSKTILVPLADGFDFPCGKPDGVGYYKARGFWPNGHLGEDWNGRGGGNTDLGDPVYSIADGVVVASDDYRKGWGNGVIVRTAYRESSGQIRMIDALYVHLDKRSVRKYQIVKRGQQLGTIGTNRGMYLAHLHFEIRKNLKIGMNRSQFPRDFSCYYSPTPFIEAHRRLRSSTRRYPVPVDTFAEYGQKLAARSPKTAPQSRVPLREDSDRPRDARSGLRPELEDIIENTAADAPSEAELESFWRRLKTRFK
ncbi:hypothetical protein BH23VER1_BH23VER1_34470 [soil metagenome]